MVQSLNMTLICFKNCSYLMWIVMIIKKMKRNYYSYYGLHIHYKHILQIHPNSNPESRQKGLTRWQTNPEKNWGPKARAKRQNQENDGSKQGKRARRRKVHCNYACTARCCVTETLRWFDIMFEEDMYNSFTVTLVFNFRTKRLKNLMRKRKQILHKWHHKYLGNSS